MGRRRSHRDDAAARVVVDRDRSVVVVLDRRPAIVVVLVDGGGAVVEADGRLEWRRLASESEYDDDPFGNQLGSSATV